jgi:hypothetical protein
MHPFHILFETVSSAPLAEKFRARELGSFRSDTPGQSGGPRCLIRHRQRGDLPARASACPVDDVAAPLLAATSAAIGHARLPLVTKPSGVSERLLLARGFPRRMLLGLV